MSEIVDAAARDTAAPVSFATQVARRTFARLGARIGIGWIGVVALCAVFAPFLANSHPLIMTVDGETSSPLLAHLTWIDVALLGAFFACLAAWLGRRRRWLVAGAAAAALLVAGVAYLAVTPPGAVVYQQYRVGLADGSIESAVFAPVPYSPTDRSRDRPRSLTAPDSSHWMGTDEDGADVLSRMIHACRIALGIGLVATGIALAVGILYGGIMGFFAGWVEILMMRFLEIFESVPQLFLLLMVVAFFGRDIYLMMVVIGLTSWPGYARYLRAEFLKLRHQDFVQAAEAHA